MKLTQLQIQQFDAWKDLNVELNPRGTTVVLGPNEAGKTTLRRFIRWVMFGSPNRWQQHGGRAGTLHFSHQGQPYRLSREERDGTHEDLRLDGDVVDNHTVRELLYGGIDEQTFDRVFGIGLKELQELGTLNTGDVTERLYGRSLGPSGEHLVSARRHADRMHAHWVGTDGQSGRLGELSRRRRELDVQLSQVPGADRYAAALSRIHQHEQRIGDINRRQQGLEHELRGHRFLLRASSPWLRQQELERELRGIPTREAVSATDLRAFEDADRQYQELRRDYQQLKTAYDSDRRRFADAGDSSAYRAHESSINALLDQRQWVQDGERRLAELRADASFIEQELREKVRQVGTGWNLDRLATVNCSPDAQFRLVQEASVYRKLVSRQARWQRRLDALRKKLEAKYTTLDASLKRLGVTDLNAAIALGNRRIEVLEQLAKLRLAEADLLARNKQIDRQLVHLESRIEFPRWITAVLWMFAFCGLGLFGAGLRQAVAAAWIVGLIFMLMGVMCIGLAWGLRAHYHCDLWKQIEQLRSDAERTDHELATLRAKIAALPLAEVGLVLPRGIAVASFETEALKNTNRRLGELEGLRQTWTWVEKTRARLATEQGKSQTRQRDAQTSRQRWGAFLKSIGLDDTASVNDAFVTWKKAYEAHLHQLRWQEGRREIDRQASLLDEFRHRMEALAGRMGVSMSRSDTLLPILSEWEHHLTGLGQRWSARSELASRLRTTRKELSTLKRRLQTRSRDRQSWLTRLGIQDRHELHSMASQHSRGAEVRAALQEVRQELLSISSSEPELAITEDDLRHFNETATRHKLTVLEKESQDLALELRRAHEELGQLQRELEAITTDRSEVELRFERAQIDGQIRQLVEDYVGGTIASETIQQAQGYLEQHAQSQSLSDASLHLGRLTEGRYTQVRAPFGQQELRLDGPARQNVRVEELSDGTREQLFLAIRLALIEDYARSGIELPVLMDDLFVNFDLDRTKAAVDAVLEFSQSGRQLLFFTCHEHVGRQFAKRGIEPLLLPERVLATTRRAG